MDSLAEWTITLIENEGYSGLGISLFLNGLGLPFPSEILLTFAGLAVHQGHMLLAPVLIVAILTKTAGLIVSYASARLWLGRRSRRVRATKNKQILFLRRMFSERGGIMVMGAIGMPGLHGLAGYAAGLAKMPWWKFGLLALAGAAIWSVGLVWLGYLAATHIQEIYSTFHSLGLITLGIIGAMALIWYSRHHEN